MVRLLGLSNPFIPILTKCPEVQSGDTVNYNEVYQYLIALSKDRSFKAVTFSLQTDTIHGLEGYEVSRLGRQQSGYLVTMNLWDLINEFCNVCVMKSESSLLLEVKREIWRVSPYVASLLLTNCQMTTLCTHQLYEGGKECGKSGNTGAWAEADLEYGLESSTPHSFTEMDPRDRTLIVTACKHFTVK